MDIQSLTARVTQEQVNDFLARLPRDQLPVEGLQIRFSAEGAHVSGSYPVMLLRVAFETAWRLRAVGGRIEAEMQDLRLAGLAAGKFRRLLLELLHDVVREHPGVSLEGETVRVDLQAGLRARGLPVSIQFTEIQSCEGFLLIRAG